MVGFAAFITGQALASTWRPMWQMIPYGLMLGIADRFLVWGLFDNPDGVSITGYLIDTAYLIAVGLAAYRLTLARRMVTQYPWLYERAGPFGWAGQAVGFAVNRYFRNGRKPGLCALFDEDVKRLPRCESLASC